MSFYSPLEEKEIRLVVLPRSPVDLSSFSLRLITVSLAHDAENPPEYLALSYTWGSEDDAHKINVEGMEFPVKPNLMQALRAIQGYPASEQKAGDCFWWIDFICINQGDNREKEVQVAMMGEIFKRSTETIVWLGEFSTEVALAILAIKKLGVLKREQRDQAKQVVTEEAATDEFKSLCELFGRRWWTRAWTLQEFLIPDQLMFLCGDQSFRRREFIRAMGWIREHGISIPGWCSVRESDGFIMASKRKKIHLIRNQSKERKKSSLFPLCDLLLYAGGSKATDRRDCVYSVLGLVSDLETFGINPVYNDHPTTAIEIFEELCRKQIDASNCLDLILFASASWRGPNREGPSWVPYWPDHLSRSNDRMAWQSFRGLTNTLGGRSKTSDQARAFYRASGNRVYRCPLNDQSNDQGNVPRAIQPGILLCEGHSLDRIDVDAAAPEGTDMDMNRQRVQLLAITGQNEHLQLQMFSYLPPDHLWRAVVLDREDDSMDTRCSPFYRDQFRHLCNEAIKEPETLNDNLREWFLANGEQVFSALPQTQRTEIIEGLRASQGSSRYASHFENQLLNVWFNMRKSPMKSKSGLWIMVPPEARNGDHIFILSGCNFPVLLRETTEAGRFELIGECYVDGFMDGEGVHPDQEGWQDIYLV